ncbi:MAG: hypothetical protein U5N56_12535 [Candidatus Marinimicrobia bacterium]|nr:hypothetical protein [Candidatus Neomarinimicrobiota bacterium]
MKEVTDEETKLMCLKGLWYLAFEADQWSVQPRIKEVLNKEHITPAIETQLSEYILSSDTEVDIDQFTDLDIPPVIKKSILTSHQNAIKANDEREKKRKKKLTILNGKKIL